MVVRRTQPHPWTRPHRWALVAGAVCYGAALVTGSIYWTLGAIGGFGAWLVLYLTHVTVGLIERER